MSTIVRMFKRAADLTRPTPTRQDASFRGQGRTRSATRRIMSVTFADGRESVSAPCLRGEAYFLSYVEPLRNARTQLEDFFNILLGRNVWAR
jgi:hypothetical protein